MPRSARGHRELCGSVGCIAGWMALNIVCDDVGWIQDWKGDEYDIALTKWMARFYDFYDIEEGETADAPEVVAEYFHLTHEEKQTFLGLVYTVSDRAGALENFAHLFGLDTTSSGAKQEADGQS